MTADEMSFGKWLRNQRRNLDLSRQALADQAGCAEITLRRVESGTLRPSRELAAILLTKVGIPQPELPAWILFARGLSSFPARGEDLPPGQPQSNLPVFLTRFIGRDKERAEILQLLSRHRLVTLTGPGGVGKTRLAAAVGKQLCDEFPGGVHMVELASLGDPALVSQRVAMRLDLVSQSKTDYAELLVNHLRTRQVLIVLDNCEHLLTACAQLVETLLKNCSRLRILATSREPLRIAGESVFQVPSLQVPGDPRALEDYTQSESLHLFEERARLAWSDFSLNSENISSVAGICRRLDGIPLAIELAAAQVGLFSVEQIEKRLQNSFDLLTGGSRTELPRQQTIRGSIDWSWKLLSDPERVLLCRLSIFSGGWGLEAAEMVGSGNGIQPQQVALLMTQLAAQSMIAISELPGGGRRYSLHEIIQQYTSEKLSEDEEKFARAQHLKYYLSFAREAGPALSGARQMDWVSRLRAEQDNLRSALDFAARNDVEAGLAIIGSLAADLDLREGLRWAPEFLGRPESHLYPHARAEVLLAYSGYLWFVQQFEASRATCEEALALFRACSDHLGEYGALLRLGSAHQFLEGMGRKREFHEQALALARSLADPAREAQALDVLGWDRRDPERSRAEWDQAIALYRKTGNYRALAFLLGVYGDALMSSGETEAAEMLLDECFALARQINYRHGFEFVLVARSRKALRSRDFAQARAYLVEWIGIAEELGNRMGYLWAQARLGYVALLEGSLAEGTGLICEAAREFHVDGNKTGLAFTLEKLAYLFTQSGRNERGVRLIAWADKTREQMGDVRPMLEQADVDRDLDACRSVLGEAAFERALAAGRMMSFDEAFAAAMEASPE